VGWVCLPDELSPSQDDSEKRAAGALFCARSPRKAKKKRCQITLKAEKLGVDAHILFDFRGLFWSLAHDRSPFYV
jgi:hypothetical protein